MKERRLKHLEQLDNVITQNIINNKKSDAYGMERDNNKTRPSTPYPIALTLTQRKQRKQRKLQVERSDSRTELIKCAVLVDELLAAPLSQLVEQGGSGFFRRQHSTRA